jgi:hypothetical protein
MCEMDRGWTVRPEAEDCAESSERIESAEPDGESNGGIGGSGSGLLSGERLGDLVRLISGDVNLINQGLDTSRPS